MRKLIPLTGTVIFRSRQPSDDYVNDAVDCNGEDDVDVATAAAATVTADDDDDDGWHCIYLYNAREHYTGHKSPVVGPIFH